jgi:hypothetical protein
MTIEEAKKQLFDLEGVVGVGTGKDNMIHVMVLDESVKVPDKVGEYSTKKIVTGVIRAL